MKMILVVLGIIASFCCSGRAVAWENSEDLQTRYQLQEQQSEIDRLRFEQRNMQFDNQLRDQQRLDDRCRDIHRETDSYRPYGTSYQSPLSR